MKCKILIAPDSFKGSISAQDAANAICRGLRAGFGTEAELIALPIADGGEGTLDALVTPENKISLTVTGTNGQPVVASYGHNGNTAVIEMASAAGLTLTEEHERSAMRATTYGVGEIIRHALDMGYRNILLTVGGSGTNDGGCGMFAALGACFFDQSGNSFVPTGKDLEKIAEIDLSSLDARLTECHFTIATDVTNPLLGECGATYVYARQKGADDAELKWMEQGMAHYASLLFSKCGKDVARIAGCGAGGGLATPLLAFLDAEICSGIEAVLKTLHFDEKLAGAHAVITGEGKIDRQSLYGKAISGVASRAKGKGIPVYCFVGCVGDDRSKLKEMGITEIYALTDIAPSSDYAIAHPAELLEQTALDFARNFKIH